MLGDLDCLKSFRDKWVSTCIRVYSTCIVDHTQILIDVFLLVRLEGVLLKLEVLLGRELSHLSAEAGDQ